ncbi:MAG: hypothetical protein ACXADX_18590 [Candidatus Hodarchaeales archaeon]
MNENIAAKVDRQKAGKISGINVGEALADFGGANESLSSKPRERVCP